MQHADHLPTYLHWHWSPHQARHIKPPNFFFLLLFRLAEGATSQAKILSLHFQRLQPFSPDSSLYAILRESILAPRGIPIACSRRGLSELRSSGISITELRREYRHSVFVCLPANQPGLFCTEFTYHRRGGGIKRGFAYRATYTRNDSGGVSIENTLSAGQDRTGTKRDAEGCLHKATLITAGDETPERQQHIMEKATVTFALGRGDAPRRSHATKC